MILLLTKSTRELVPFVQSYDSAIYRQVDVNIDPLHLHDNNCYLLDNGDITTVPKEVRSMVVEAKEMANDALSEAVSAVLDDRPKPRTTALETWRTTATAQIAALQAEIAAMKVATTHGIRVKTASYTNINNNAIAKSIVWDTPFAADQQYDFVPIGYPMSVVGTPRFTNIIKTATGVTFNIALIPSIGNIDCIFLGIPKS